MNKYLFEIIVGIVVAVLLVVFVISYNTPSGPWYLGCSDGVKEYLMKVDDKPVIQGSFIRIGKDTFVTPVAGMTCKIVPVSDVEGIDKGNSI